MVNDPALVDLKDIHLPDGVSVWPLAPGYYLLSLIIIAFAIIAYFCVRRYQRNAFKREALVKLNEILAQFELHQDQQAATSAISLLLKRIALIYYPRMSVAGLHPNEWVTFLENHAKKLDFSPVRNALIKGPYQPHYKDDATSLLFILAKQWIKQQRGPHV